MSLPKNFERKPGQEEATPLTSEQRKMLASLSERLRTLCRTISGDLSMRVDSGRPGEGWYWNAKTNEVYFDPIDVLEKGEEAENILKGIISHEAGHRVITRWPMFVPPEVLQELGFHALLNATEERPTDQVVRDRYAGAGQWVDDARRDSLERDNHDLSEMAKEKLGSIPKFLQFCELATYHPHLTPEMRERYDEDVLAFYEQQRMMIEAIEHQLPEEGAKESEIIRLAKERYRKTYKELWPKVKEFAKQDLEMAALQNLLQDLMQNLLQQKLAEQLKDIAEKLKGEMKPSGEGAGQQAVPMGGLTPEDLKALHDAFNGLPAEKRAELQERAKKALESLEDKLVESFEAKLQEHQETHADNDEKIEREKQAEEKRKQHEKEREQIAHDLQEVEKRRQAIEHTSPVYERTYQEVRELDEVLYQHLDQIFHPSTKKKVRLKSTGSRLNLPAVYKWEAARGASSRGLDTRIFETVHIPEKKDYAITLLVDLSGSMSEGKIQETFKGVILLTEVLNRLGIKVEILGFQDQVITFKDFDENLSDAVRRRMSGMIAETQGHNPGGLNNPDFNDDGPCVAEASRRLNGESAKEKILMVFSDGLPAGSHSSAEDLIDAVHQILTTTDQKLVAIGLGPDTEHVKHYYPASLPNIDVQQLPEVLAGLLEDLISNPEKYRAIMKENVSAVALPTDEADDIMDEYD